MKKVKIILNPSSGKQLTEKKVEYLTKLLLDDGYTVARFMTKKKDDAMKETIKSCKEDWDMIIACGGDGTVNEVAQGIVKSENKLPVAILSTGTVNDFANYMNIPNDVNGFFEMIKRNKIIEIDIGRSNDDYFVNVAAGGILTSVGYQVHPEAKALLGRMAYYFEGLIELVRQGLDPIKARFESEEYTSEEKILLFLISNSSSIGGFKKLAPDADVLDGLLDVLIIKNSDVPELANIFFNVLRGGHVNHPNVIYFKTKDITISSDRKVSIDIDGEYGGTLPVNFKVYSKAMKILI